jgi:hypothetical protein
VISCASVAQALAACGSYQCLQNIVAVRNGSAAVPAAIFKRVDSLLNFKGNFSFEGAGNFSF